MDGRGSKKRFYAVRAGRAPGVYGSVGEAQEQCRGVAGAVMQGFRLRADAQAFATAATPPTVGVRGRGLNNYSYYAVRVGVRPGVYGSNAEAQAQIQRVPGAIYKGFNSQAEAEAFVAGGRSVAATGAVKRPRPDY